VSTQVRSEEGRAVIRTQAYAASSASEPLAPTAIDRREPGDDDVLIRIHFCGVCHSDVYAARNSWGRSKYPLVPGHEIVGRVQETGANARGFAVGDWVAVGCIVDSCRKCSTCGDGLEQFCERGFTNTYNAPDRHLGGNTYGGYSSHIVVDRRYVLRVPAGLDPARAAPLLCAGITTYSPLRHAGVKAGHQVGVVGLGGLGHMAVKLARAMGAEVTLFTTSPGKREDAIRLGAQHVIVCDREGAWRKQAGRYDVILDTVSASHDLDDYVGLLRLHGKLILVGIPDHPHPSPSIFTLVWNRRSLLGSMIGGIAETQEMLDFCAAHDLAADIEFIRMDQINDAFARLDRGDVRYRFVIRMEDSAFTQPFDSNAAVPL